VIIKIKDKTMYRIVTIALSLSICFASDDIQSRMDKLMKSLQEKYQVYSLEDLENLTFQPQVENRTLSSRDMDDLFGEWFVEEQNFEMYVTVGHDQSMPNIMQMIAMMEAEGNVTVTASDYETELTYMLYASMLEMDNGDDDDDDPLFLGEDDYNAFSTLIYAQNYTALIFAQDYVNDYSSNHGQSSFELDSVFNLVIEGDNVSGGLGGNNPGNCEINWPEDPYRMAVYSFVSEYVLSEGGSVGCFVDDGTLDQTFAYVALEMESLWSGGDGGNDGDDDSDLFIMNFGFLDFFLFMFGMPPEGVDNPLMVMINFEEEIVAAQGLTAFGQDPDIYVADPSDVASSVSFDMDEQTLIITELSLMDSTETAVLSLNGTIGPGMIELLAGVVTEMPIPMLDGEEDIPEVYMIFNEDSTGMEIEITEDEDYGDMIDTSYFDWFATSDSLWLFEDEWICDGGEGYTDSFSSEEECNEECNTDCYYDEDNDGMAIYYEFSDDTLFISVTEYPCEDFNDYDECIEEGEMDLFIGELEDIQDFYIHNTLVMLPTGDDVSLADVTVMPEKFTLHQNYPNPFNPVTTLRYDLPENGNVNITIYDMLGRQVKTLINQNQDAGYRSVVWNATNNYGEPVSAGIYLYQIQAGEYMQTKKMVLLK